MGRRIEKYQIPFAVNMLKDQPDKTKFTWSVKALPWLVLADQKHIVQVEGFGIDELDERLPTMEREKKLEGM